MATKIIDLQVSNVKRVRAVEIAPDTGQPVVVIGGRNGQGKTSVLDAIEYALGGKPTGEPLRAGERKGYVVAELSNGFVVERTFTRTGTYLKVRAKDGSSVSSPQEALDAMVGPIAFDPLAFMSMRPKAQVETLRELVGLDFSQLDETRKQAYDERHGLNQTLRFLEESLKDMEHYEDAPSEQVDGAGLRAERARIVQWNEEVAAAESDVREAKARESAAEAARTSAVERMQAAETDYNEAVAHHNSRTEEVAALVAALDGMDRKTSGDVDARIEALDAQNVKAAANQRRKEKIDEQRTIAAKSQGHTDTIDRIDLEKREKLAETIFPIEGLEFDETQVLFNDVPFAQASGAEQLRVSVAMGAAMNPELRVLLVRDGSLLDDDSMKLLYQLAEAHDTQVFLERVGAGEEVTVLIEDGQVAG